MKNSLHICNIYRINKNGIEYIKFPKLGELYEFLFQTTFENSHDSLFDAFCCLRCFYLIQYNIDLFNDNKVMKVFIKLNNNI
jgi:hypothetical protein